MGFISNWYNYRGIRPFRFWCQKVLPLVYDDSLSYYELLNKVVDYINNMITDLSTMEDNIDILKDAYEQLEEYVNGYLTDERMQELVNNKLDDMAEAGELDILLNSLTHITVKDSDNVVLFDAADEYGRTFAQGLRLASYREGTQDIGLILDGLKTQSENTVEYSQQDETTGLNLHMLMHENVVHLAISLDSLQELSLSNQYVTFGMHTDMRPQTSVALYAVVAAQYTAQINILTNGQVQFGFTKRISDGQPANIPEGTRIRAAVCYLSSYGQTYV